MTEVLVIDDRSDNLISISALLRSSISDRSAVTASSGAEGLEKAKVEMPDTILLDIKMPGMDGYEVCSRLKSDDETQHIPVIMMAEVGDGLGAITNQR